MRDFLAAALLGLFFGFGLAGPANAVEVGCIFPTADDARPCGYESYFYIGETTVTGTAIVQVADRKDVYSASCDWNQNGIGTPYFGKCPETGEQPAPVINPDAEAWEHARRTYDSVIENGGCNADFVPVEYAKYCWGKNWASEGGSD